MIRINEKKGDGSIFSQKCTEESEETAKKSNRPYFVLINGGK